MVGWIILGVVVGLIVLVLCLRVGVVIRLGEELQVTACIGPKKLRLVPPPERKPKKKKPEKAVQPSVAEKHEKKKLDLHLTAGDIRAGLRAVWQSIQGTLRRVGRRIRIDPLELCFVFGDDDPAAAAELYGWANAAIWTVMPRLEEAVHMPSPHIHMEVDFQAAATRVSGEIGASFRIGDLLVIGWAAARPLLRFGLPLLKRQRAAAKAKAAVEKAPETTPPSKAA